METLSRTDTNRMRIPVCWMVITQSELFDNELFIQCPRPKFKTGLRSFVMRRRYEYTHVNPKREISSILLLTEQRRSFIYFTTFHLQLSPKNKSKSHHLESVSMI